MIHKDSKLLTTIQLKDGRTLTGIVDFIIGKQLYFFDFSHEYNIDYLMLTLLWRGNHPHLRFSVYCTIHFPELILPRAILIPLSNIEQTNHHLTKNIKQKVRKIRIKL